MVLVLAIIERVGLPVPMVIGYVMANLGVYASEEKSMFTWAFLAGLIIDLVFMNVLGITSLMLLISRGLLVYMHRKWGREMVWMLAGVSGVGTLAVEWVTGNTWRWLYAAGSSLIALGFYVVMGKVKPSGNGVFVYRR